jgi:hypothetical protein
MAGSQATRFVDVAKDIKPFEGHLTIQSIDRKGNIYVFDTPNIITFDARVVMSHLLVGDQVSTYKIGFIAVGLSNTAPVRADTSLVQQVHQQPIEPYDFPSGDTGQVEITATLDFTSVTNGNTLREAGLVSANGTTLFARQIHGAIAKDSSIQLQYIWRIIFT